MDDTQLATIIQVIAVVVGLVLAVIGGYVLGYKDGKRHQEKDQ